MHVRELMQQIGREAPPPVLLFCPGTAPFQKEPFEPYLADRAIDAMVEEYVDPSMRDMVYAVFHADEKQVGDIVLEAQTLPFLAERRVIVVRNADRYVAMSGEKGSALTPLIRYLKSPSESTLLMMVTSRIDKRKTFYKACKELGGIVECPQLTDEELSRWAHGETEKLGKSIEPRAIKELLARSGSRLSDVNNAVNLVATYVGEAESIREEDVVAACADVAEESVWALTDAIASSDPRKALETLYQLIDFGKSPDEIMGLINWLLESAYRASPQTGCALKSQFVAKKVMPLAQKLGAAKLKDAFALCTKTHFMIRSTGVDKMLALELLVIKLAAPRRRRAR